jgi:hypothetical protein
MQSIYSRRNLIDGQTGMTLPLNELGTYCKHNMLGICGDKMLLIGTFEFDCWDLVEIISCWRTG